MSDGEDLIVTRTGVPVGELRPLRRRFVRTEQLLSALRGAPPIEAGRFRADVDALLDQSI